MHLHYSKYYYVLLLLVVVFKLLLWLFVWFPSAAPCRQPRLGGEAAHKTNEAKYDRLGDKRILLSTSMLEAKYDRLEYISWNTWGQMRPSTKRKSRVRQVVAPNEGHAQPPRDVVDEAAAFLWLHVYVCIYIYIYMHICIMYIYLSLSLHIHIYIYIYIHIHTYTYTHAYVYTCIYIYIYRCMCTYVCMCIYIYIYIHIYAWYTFINSVLIST